MTDTTEQQATLADLFDSELVWDEQIVRVEELPNTDHIDVRRSLSESIADVGVLVPILLASDGKHLTIIDGRHRVAAARAVGEREVPARVASTRGTGIDAITLIANTQRSANVIAEYDAIVNLMRNGSNENDVARLTGIPVGTIRKRLKIANLNDALMARFRAGEMSAPAAEAASALSKGRQEKLADETSELAKIRYRDIHDARQVEASDAANSLPSDIFGASASEQPNAEREPQIEPQPYTPSGTTDARATIIAVATIALDNNSTKAELAQALADIRAIAQQM